jgi:hypothetical protein
MIDSFNRAPGGDLFISEVFVAYPWWKRRSTTTVGLDIRHASAVGARLYSMSRVLQ